MRHFFLLATLLLSTQAFSQTDSLAQCRARSERLRFQVRELSSRLNACEAQNTGTSSREVERLRSENYRLVEENRQLLLRLDQLEGRYYEQFFCSAGCANSNYEVDTRYMASAVASNRVEAEFLAGKEVSKSYGCNFGVKTYKCESFTSDVQMNFCSVACADSNGRADQRYSAGGKGRNKAEAEYNATLELKKNYGCNFGTAVIACN